MTSSEDGSGGSAVAEPPFGRPAKLPRSLGEPLPMVFLLGFPPGPEMYVSVSVFPWPVCDKLFF